jgi:hypothetical protein
MQPCLHIGMPKTGTKTLQMCLFARHSQVDFLGTYTGNQRQWPRQCRDEDIQELMAELIWDCYRSPSISKARAIFDRAVSPSQQRGRVPVWSWESLMENRPEVQRQRAENLRAVFGECKVIATIRHPLKLVESLYLQLLKRDNVGGRARMGRPPRFEPIDQWIRANWDSIGSPPKAHLEYPEALEIFAEVFGRENVRVFLFEQLLTDPRAYYEAICSFVGIDAEEAVAHCEGERENQRWTEPQLQRLREVHGSLWSSTVFRIAPRTVRRQMLGFPRQVNAASPPHEKSARIVIADPLQEAILEKTRPGNRRIAHTWNLPLDAYQYPV